MKRKKRLKQTCLDCHFLVKRFEQKFVFNLSDKDKEDIQRNNFERLKKYSLSCHMNVWSEGVGGFIESNKYNVIVNTERKNYCFFWKYTPGMLLPAAKILQKREAANKAASRDRWLTIIGLWIAASALAADIIINLFKKP